MAQSYVPLFTKILLETVIVTVLGITEIYLAFLPSSLFPLPQKKTSIRPTRSWKLTVEKYRPLFVALFLSFFFANHSLLVSMNNEDRNFFREPLGFASNLILEILLLTQDGD